MKTDNSYFKEKFELRLQNLPKKDSITVLDCFAGKGKIWDSIKKKSSNQILIVSIKKESNKNKFALPGSNLKYLSILDLSQYDIIDLDSYGIPYRQLDIIFKRKYKGIIFITAIQSGMGRLPNNMLFQLGYTEKMIKTITSIFNKKGLDKLKNYLYLHGVETITGYFIDRKNYFMFNTNH